MMALQLSAMAMVTGTVRTLNDVGPIYSALQSVHQKLKSQLSTVINEHSSLLTEAYRMPLVSGSLKPFKATMHQQLHLL